MTPLTSIQQKYIALGVSFGVDVVTCITNDEPSGKATVNDDGQFCVCITGDTASPMFLFVLLHEYVHIAMGHVGNWTSEPTWSIEYSCDTATLALIKDIAPETYCECEANAKQHIRSYIQPWVDKHIDHHLHTSVIDWCNAKISKKHRNKLISQEKIGSCDEDVSIEF